MFKDSAKDVMFHQLGESNLVILQVSHRLPPNIKIDEANAERDLASLPRVGQSGSGVVMGKAGAINERGD
jgi:hypothetical protein